MYKCNKCKDKEYIKYKELDEFLLDNGHLGGRNLVIVKIK